MACTGTNWKKRKDIVYMRFMATIFGKNTGKTMGIYEETRRDVGKIYNFEEVKEGKEYVEVIRLDKNVTSKAVLSSYAGYGLDVVDSIGESTDGDVDTDVVGDSGSVLQDEQSDTVSDRPKQSNKDRKPKK